MWPFALDLVKTHQGSLCRKMMLVTQPGKFVKNQDFQEDENFEQEDTTLRIFTV